MITDHLCPAKRLDMNKKVQKKVAIIPACECHEHLILSLPTPDRILYAGLSSRQNQNVTYTGDGQCHLHHGQAKNLNV